jgi:restriction system protein
MPLFLLTAIGLLAIFYLRKKLPKIKGYIGERYVIQGLTKHLDEIKYTIFNDVTLPLEYGGTTQVDHIVVSNFGIFVIEKNMSGWIFDSENQVNWTQTIRRSKHSFQNPLRQNYKHTKTLSLLLNLPHDQFHSIVTFTPNAELKTKFLVVLAI